MLFRSKKKKKKKEREVFWKTAERKGLQLREDHRLEEEPWRVEGTGRSGGQKALVILVKAVLAGSSDSDECLPLASFPFACSTGLPEPT